jgi:DNA-binding Xre family transcriptional regulator
MKNWTMTEIIAFQPQMKELLTSLFIANPDLRHEELGKKIGIDTQVLTRFLTKQDASLRTTTLMKIFNYLVKIKKIQ